jgi:hypothetical protein
MLGEGHHDSIVQRGIDEALACQDLLEQTTRRPSVLTRAISRIALVIRSTVHWELVRNRRVIPTTSRGTR